MKIKHNKKRNTAFLYEVLSRELTKAIVSHKKQDKEALLSLVREFFKKGSVLSEELNLYKTLSEESDLDPYTAEKMIHRCKEKYSQLNKNKIFETQSQLISKINKSFGGGVFTHFIPQYKSFATIAQIFNDHTPVKHKVLMEKQILETLSSTKKKAEELVPVDSLGVRQFVENFNKKYSYLLPEQQELLGKYILSIGDNVVDFQIALKEELKRLYNLIEESLEIPEVASDENMVKNTQKLLEDMGHINVVEISESQIKKVLKIQSLVREYEKNDNQD
jgi:hypothetical protein